MKNNGVKYGLFYGLGLSLLAVLAYFIDPKLLFVYTDWQTILSLILMFGLMYWSAKVTREESGGYIGFGEAFVPPFLTYLIGGTIFNLLFYALITADPELLDIAGSATNDMMASIYKAAGMSEDQILEVAEQTENLMDGSNPFSIGSMLLGALVYSFFIGLPLSAIIAAIVKKKRPDVV
jgi:hypothetical protein